MKYKKAIASALIVSMFCCSCSKTVETTRDNGDKENRYDLELPEDEVLFITGSKNEAWGHHSSITYVMSDGKVYSSTENFESYWTDSSMRLTDEQRKDLLIKYTEPVAELKEKDLKKIYYYMLQIDTGAEFVYADEFACDAGTYYRNVNIDGEFIKISEYGDRTGNLKDRCAKKVDKLIDAAFESATFGNHAAVYSNTESFIKTIRCSDIETKDVRRIITSMEELEAFRKDTGINLLKYDAFDYFGDKDYDRFSNTCVAVELVAYPEYLSVEDVTADAFIVSDSYVGFAYIEDPVIDVSDDIVPENWYVHVVQLPNYQLDDYDLFLKGT